MPGLTIVLLTDDAERLRGALTLALAQRALGGECRLFLQLDAVRLLAPETEAPRDDIHVAHGLPRLASLIGEALDDGVTLVACQSGLALAGLEASRIDPRIEAGGPVSLLQSLAPEERLTIA
jgi:predicted peroxiredoxin